MTYDPQKHHRRSIRLKGYDYARPGAYFVTLATWQRECLFGEVVHGEVRLSPLGEIVRQEWDRSSQIRGEIELYDDQFVIMPNHIHGVVWLVDVGADGVRPTYGVGVDGIHPAYGAGVDGVGADGVRPTHSVHPTHPGIPIEAEREGRGAHDDLDAHDGLDEYHDLGAHDNRGAQHDQGAQRDQDAYHDRDARDNRGARRDWDAHDDLGAHDDRGAHDNRGARRDWDPNDDWGAHRDRGARRAPLQREGRSLGSFVAGFKASVTSRARLELEIWNVWQRNYYEHIIRNEADLARICEYIQTNPRSWEDDQLHPAAAPNRFNQES